MSRPHHERGESLIEVILALAILGIAVVAILGSMSTLVIGTDVHRQQSSATAVLLSAAESVKGPDTAYLACADLTAGSPTEATDYKNAIADISRVPRPTGWAAPRITRIAYWDGSAFGSTCFDKAEFGSLLKLQSITVEVTDPGSRATESLTVVKRSQP